MILLLVKAAIALGLIALLVMTGSLQFEPFQQLLSSPLYLMAAIFLIVLVFPISAWRWYKLLSAAGFKVSFGRANSINYRAAFVGMYLPGSIGTDVAKLAISRAQSLGRFSSIAATVFMDRVFGLIGLLFLGMMAAAALKVVVPDAPNRGGFNPLVENLPLYVSLTLFVVFLLFTGVLAILWIGKKYLPEVILWQRFHVNDLLAGLHNGLILYRAHPAVLFEAFFWSVVVHVLDLLALIAIATAMLDVSIYPLIYAISGVLSALVNAVPITPGGLGVGEAAFAQLMNLFAPENSGAPYATIYLAHRVVRVLIVVPGAFLFFRKRDLAEVG